MNNVPINDIPPTAWDFDWPAHREAPAWLKVNLTDELANALLTYRCSIGSWFHIPEESVQISILL
jgi:hypothetical protein